MPEIDDARFRFVERGGYIYKVSYDGLGAVVYRKPDHPQGAFTVIFATDGINLETVCDKEIMDDKPGRRSHA